MTDNEIIKALECCSTAQNCTPCKYEPTEYRRGTIGCCNELMKNTIDLIKRQQAEIEKCKTILTELSNIGYCHNFQLERSDIVDYINAVSEVVKKAKNKLEGDNGE